MVFCSSLFLRVAGRLAVGSDLTRSLDSGWRGVWCVCVCVWIHSLLAARLHDVSAPRRTVP